MSDLALSEAGALAEAGGQLTNLMVQQTTGLSDLRRAYTSSLTGLQTQLASTMLEGGSQIAQAGFDTDMGRAQNIGTGFNLGGALLGAGVSALTGGIAGGIGASMMGGTFSAGLSSTLMGGGAEYFKTLQGGNS